MTDGSWQGTSLQLDAVGQDYADRVARGQTVRIGVKARYRGWGFLLVLLVGVGVLLALHQNGVISLVWPILAGVFAMLELLRQDYFAHAAIILDASGVTRTGWKRKSIAWHQISQIRAVLVDPKDFRTDAGVPVTVYAVWLLGEGDPRPCVEVSHMFDRVEAIGVIVSARTGIPVETVDTTKSETAPEGRTSAPAAPPAAEEAPAAAAAVPAAEALATECDRCGKSFTLGEVQFRLEAGSVICARCRQTLGKFDSWYKVILLCAPVYLLLVTVGFFGPWYSDYIPHATAWNVAERILFGAAIVAGAWAFLAGRRRLACGILFVPVFVSAVAFFVLQSTVGGFSVGASGSSSAEETARVFAQRRERQKALAGAIGWGYWVSFLGTLATAVAFLALEVIRTILKKEAEKLGVD